MSGCFVLKMEKFLPQRVGRFEVNRDMMFTEEGEHDQLPMIQHLELP